MPLSLFPSNLDLIFVLRSEIGVGVNGRQRNEIVSAQTSIACGRRFHNRLWFLGGLNLFVKSGINLWSRVQRTYKDDLTSI